MAASNANGNGPPAQGVLDAHLITTLSTRIESIVAKLQDAAKDAHSLSVKAKENDSKEQGDSSKQGGPNSTESTSVSMAAEAAPSVALGAVSDDDHSMYDFLFSGGGGAGSPTQSTSGTPGSQPTELSLSLLKEARELREVYSHAIRAAESTPGGEWSMEEQRQAIRELRTLKSREEQFSQRQGERGPSIPSKRRATDDDEEEGSFSSLLVVHLRLSSQITQAIFAAIHSAYSTALPPSPIPRPDRLPPSLRQLPLWRQGQSSPKLQDLIPSLLVLHASLYDVLLRARTHRANGQILEQLTHEVKSLRSQRRRHIKDLQSASADLRYILSKGKEAKKSMALAEARPTGFKDVLEYAAELARVTSAPPQWATAVKKGSSDVKESTVGAGGVKAEDVADDVGQEVQGTPEVKGRDKQTEGGAGGGASSSLLLHALQEQQQQQQGVTGVMGPDQSLAAGSSAPHSLPFPSDADLRRGLMGGAMLADMDAVAAMAMSDGGNGVDPASAAAGMKTSRAMRDLLPSWRHFLTLKRQEEEAMAATAMEQRPGGGQLPVAGDPDQASRRHHEAAMSRRERPDMEESSGFGLDL
ncbi:unnamed protein product [Jaminaea pallidilutea]